MLDNSQAPGAVEIKEGKVEGDKISFHIVRQMNDQDTKIQWTGTLSGDEVKFKRDNGGGGTPGGMGGFGGGAPGGGIGMGGLGGAGANADLVAKRDKN